MKLIRIHADMRRKKIHNLTGEKSPSPSARRDSHGHSVRGDHSASTPRWRQSGVRCSWPIQSPDGDRRDVGPSRSALRPGWDVGGVGWGAKRRPCVNTRFNTAALFFYLSVTLVAVLDKAETVLDLAADHATVAVENVLEVASACSHNEATQTREPSLLRTGLGGNVADPERHGENHGTTLALKMALAACATLSAAENKQTLS